MTLRGEIESFPIETVVQLIHSTSKTGQLEVRGTDGAGGTLGFDGGRLIAAIAGEEAGEPALGAVFAVADGTFEFIPWADPPAANLAGDLDQLLDKAAEERDRIVAIRKVIPDDRSRFRLSERAADKGNITLSSDQWRTLLAVNSERDVHGVADHLKAGKVATRASLAALVEQGFVDVLEPAPAPEQWSPPTSAWVAPAPEAQTWAPPQPGSAPQQPESVASVEAPAPSWEQSTPAPAPQTWEPQSTPAPSWEQSTPAPAPQTWEPAPPEPQSAQIVEQPAPAPQWATPETDRRDDLAAALDARMSAIPSAPAAEPEAASVTEISTAQDERLSALSGVFGPAQSVAPGGPPGIPAPDRINEWSRMAPTMQAEPAPEEKKKGLFGFLKRDEPAREAEATTMVAPGATAAGVGRAGQLASLANALLAEYNSGQYGKGRLDDRMANLLMRVDEQADPIDRPLPIVDDRIDAQALDRENMPEQQAVPYLAILVSQIYEDAERTFGKDKAKRGYKAAQQQVFGTDASALSAPDVAGRLPKV
jgi:hypothetical protein